MVEGGLEGLLQNLVDVIDIDEDTDGDHDLDDQQNDYEDCVLWRT